MDYKDRFLIKKSLGEGGYGKTYLAIDTDSGQKVTLKVFKNISQNNTEEVLLKNLSHSAIPGLVDSGSDYVALEYIDGITLEEYLKENGALSEKTAVSLSKKIISVLIYLHSRKTPIIYRDLKPGNIILGSDGEVYLIDFGAARIYNPDDEKDIENLGTLGYAAPEQFGNLGQTDPRTDIYCFGMMLLRLVTAVDLTDQEAIEEYKTEGVRGISEEFIQIVDKCTRPDRDDRFKSAREVERALLTYQGRVKRRKIFSVVKTAIAAAVIAFIVSMAAMNGQRIIDVASSDMEKRMPYVQDRLYSAKCRIGEEIFKVKVGEN